MKRVVDKPLHYLVSMASIQENDRFSLFLLSPPGDTFCDGICLFVCLSVDNFTQKIMNGFQ